MLPASQPDEREGSEGAVACMHRACCSNCNHNQLGLSLPECQCQCCMPQCHWPPCRSSWISILSKLRDYSEQCMHSARGRWTWTLDPGQEAMDRSIVASAWIISNSDGARAATIVRGACLHMAGRWWQALFAATAGRPVPEIHRRWLQTALATNDVLPCKHASLKMVAARLRSRR